ncbi:hypothetical protein [Bauldia sp.]|uniref:hypothetical protein n=1 Tax=Bauldia sp. TaxID=2575872 RepID=UPI003BA8A840
MRIVTTSVVALAAAGVFAVGSASACEWQKNVTASVVPETAQEEMATPATEIDPVRLAELQDAAIVPRKPEEVEAE